MRHRYFLAAPFVVLLLVTLVGGQLNTVNATGTVIDTSTGQPVKGVTVTYANTGRGAVSGEDGTFFIPNLPRGARLRTNAPGYQPANASAEDQEVRLTPGTLSLQVNEEGTEDTRVSGVEVRQGTKVLAKCTADPCGQLVITTIDIVGQTATICAPAHESKDIALKGVTLVTTLRKQEGAGCPPLPTPTPSPSPSPSPSPTPSPSPSPTATP